MTDSAWVVVKGIVIRDSKQLNETSLDPQILRIWRAVENIAAIRLPEGALEAAPAKKTFPGRSLGTSKKRFFAVSTKPKA